MTDLAEAVGVYKPRSHWGDWAGAFVLGALAVLIIFLGVK